MFELRNLRYFVAVAERLNVTRAAEAINISQSALSRQIHGLEADLGVRLFDRIGKRLELTAEGADFLIQAAALLEAADGVAGRVRGHAEGKVGYLRVGATPQTIEGLMSLALARFRLSHPAVEVALMEGNNERLIEWVETGAAHLAVAALPGVSELRAKDLFSAHLRAVLPPDDPRRTLAALEMAALEGDTLLLLQRGFMTREMFDRAAATASFRPRALLESVSPHTLLALARAGHGVAIVSSTVSLQAGRDHAVPLVLNGAAVTRPVSVVWNPARHRPPAMTDFEETLEAVAATVHAAG